MTPIGTCPEYVATLAMIGPDVCHLDQPDDLAHADSLGQLPPDDSHLRHVALSRPAGREPADHGTHALTIYGGLREPRPGWPRLDYGRPRARRGRPARAPRHPGGRLQEHLCRDRPRRGPWRHLRACRARDDRPWRQRNVVGRWPGAATPRGRAPVAGLRLGSTRRHHTEVQCEDISLTPIRANIAGSSRATRAG
jgi:hypothetical protein